MLLARWGFILRRLGLVMLLYSILRCLFFGFNHVLFTQATSAEISRAFLYGLRFDLSATVATNALFILLCLVPRPEPMGAGYLRFLKTLFLALNIPFLLISAIDLDYFGFNGRRSTLDLLSLSGDAGVKWLGLITSYWPVLLVSVVLSVALWLFYGRTAAATPAPAPRTRLGLGPEPRRRSRSCRRCDPRWPPVQAHQLGGCRFPGTKRTGAAGPQLFTDGDQELQENSAQALPIRRASGPPALPP